MTIALTSAPAPDGMSLPSAPEAVVIVLPAISAMASS